MDGTTRPLTGSRLPERKSVIVGLMNGIEESFQGLILFRRKQEIVFASEKEIPGAPHNPVVIRYHDVKLVFCSCSGA